MLSLLCGLSLASLLAPLTARVALAGPPDAQAKRSPLLAAMQTELDRSVKTLGAQNPPAYYIGYTITDTQRADVSGSNGALLSSSENRNRWLEVSVRTGLEPGHAGQVDQPRPVHPHDIERRQPRFLGGQGAPDEVIDAVGKAVLDIISGRTDPQNVARFDADAR